MKNGKPFYKEEPQKNIATNPQAIVSPQAIAIPFIHLSPSKMSKPILKKRPKDILEWEVENIKDNNSGIPISTHVCYYGGYQIKPLGVSDIDYQRVGRALTKF